MKITWKKLRDNSYFGIDEEENHYLKQDDFERVICYLAPHYNFYGVARNDKTALKTALNRAFYEKQKWNELFEK